MAAERSAARQAAEIAVGGRLRAIDAGLAECPDGRASFMTVAALGFDAHVAERTNALRWPHGRLRYYLALVIELLRLRPMPFVLGLGEADSGHAPQLKPGILIAVGNTRSYGGGMPMCPEAEPDDGLFDVTHIAPIGRAKLVRLFPLLLRAEHLRRPEVRSLRASQVTVAAPGLVVYADGERVGTESVSLSVQPGALTMLVPGA